MGQQKSSKILNAERRYWPLIVESHSLQEHSTQHSQLKGRKLELGLYFHGIPSMLSLLEGGNTLANKLQKMCLVNGDQ